MYICIIQLIKIFIYIFIYIRNSKSHSIQTIVAIQNSQLENVHKKSSKKNVFSYLFIMKKSVVWLVERVNNVWHRQSPSGMLLDNLIGLLKPHWSFSLRLRFLELRLRVLECPRVPSASPRVPLQKLSMYGKFSKTLPLRSLNTKALRVLIVQSPRTINLFQLIKLLKPWNLFCFAFLALIGGAARQNITFPTEFKMAAPRRWENKKKPKKKQKKKKRHTNKHRITKQHSSSIYVGLLHLHLIPSVFSPPPAQEVAPLCESKFSIVSSSRDRVAV